MRIRKLNTGIRTLSQSERGVESTELALCRFDYDNNEAIITVGGATNRKTYTLTPASGGEVFENGDILEGVTVSDAVSGDGDETRLGQLLSEWNTESNARLMLLRLNDGAEGHFELGVEDYVVLPFSTAEPVHFNIGDYVDLSMVLDTAQGDQFAKRYEICEFPKPTINISTGGYDYELRLDAYYMKWKNKIFRYLPTEVELGEMAQGEASWSLTANLETHLSVFLRNLRSLGYTYGKDDTEFIAVVDSVYNTQARLVTYEGVNMIDALTAMAEAFECEWWVTENAINFGKCELSGDLMQIEVGEEAQQMSHNDSEGTFATRIYAFGSERNLQSNYRETKGEVTVSGVVQRRLMLPEDVPFVDAWRYDSAGTRIYTAGYREDEDGGTVYSNGYKVDANGKETYVGTSLFSTLTTTLHIGGYKINQSREANGKITLSRTYYSESEYSALKAMTVEEVVEAIIQTDDIYPRTNDSVTRVSMYVKKFDRSEEGDSGEVIFDDLTDSGTFDPDSVTLSDSEYLQYYFRVKSAYWGESFTEEHIMDGETLSIVFTSGDLNGMEFDVMFLGGDTYASPGDGKWFEIVANDTYGRTLPDWWLKPAEGNTFVLYNWQSLDTDTGEVTSQQMIDNAEVELLAYAIQYLHNTMVDDGVYECELNPAYVYDETLSEGTERDSAYSQRTFAVGQRILLVNDALFDVPRESRVVGFTVNIDIPYDHPTYKVGESVQYSRIGAVESKVESIIYNGSTYTGTGGVTNISGTSVYLIKEIDNTAPSNTNAYSALRARNDFLHKDSDDTMPYNLTVSKVLKMMEEAIAYKGMRFGQEFVTGLLGTGGMIDGNGNAELDSLSLRKWLEVPEIRYNRTTVTVGITWHTVGAGKIESVEIDTDPTTGENLSSGIITLKLEDGEIGAIAEGDLCMGVFHDFEDVNVNETETSDSKTGNFKFQGFGTVYFRVDEILDESDNSRFRYVLRGVSERWTAQNHPRPYMDFACYANADTENHSDRQECTYETTNYLIALDNMNDWEYGGANIYYIRGKLDGFSPNGTELKGNGVYLGNVYFYGTLQQLLDAPYQMAIDTEGDQFIAPNDSQPFKATCTVYKGGTWNDKNKFVTKWTITRESGDTASDAVWNADHTDFAGYIELTYDDLGTNYNTQSTLFRATAEGTDTDDGSQTFSVSGVLDVH